MVVRTRNDPQTNATFELLTKRLGKLERLQLAMSGALNQAQSGGGSTVTKATPSVPFKIGEIAGGDGIKIAVSIRIPSNASIVRFQLVTVFDNTRVSGETDAQAIARAVQTIKPYRIEISDKERMQGVCIRIIEQAIHLRDNPEKRKFHLTQLVTRSLNEDAVQRNPTTDPYSVFPFTSFIVRNDAGLTTDEQHYFTIGDSGVSDGPSIPNIGLIVGNTPDLDTQAADATVTFKVFASEADHNLSFADLEIDTCHVHLQPFSDAVDNTGETDSKLRPGGVIADRTTKFTLISTVLPLGKHYKWTKTVTRNAAGKPRVATPNMVQDFYAGGTPATAGIPELETFTIGSAQINNEKTLITLTIKQFANSPTHLFAVLLKRAIITVTEPSGSTVKEKKIPLLDEEDIFIQGQTTVFQRKVQHTANKIGIIFGATIFAINHTTAVPIKRDAVPATGNSTFNMPPSAPSNVSGFLVTAPDDDTADGNDAYADFAVLASATDINATWRSTGTDHIEIKLRKVSPDGEPDGATKTPKIPFPIEQEDLDNVSAVFRVRNLKTGRPYVWVKNIAIRSGINVPSAKTDIAFRAGLMLLDPSGVAINLTAVPGQKRNSVVVATIGQTIPPVNLKNIQVFQDIVGAGNDADFIAVRKRRIKDNPLITMTPVAGFGTISGTTTLAIAGSGLPTPNSQFAVGDTLIAGTPAQVRIIIGKVGSTQITVDQAFSPALPGGTAFTSVGTTVQETFKIHIPPMKAGIRYFARIVAIGNGSKDSAKVTQSAMGVAEAPTQLPSNPSLVDIIANTFNGDIRHGHAKVTFRIYASWMRNTTAQGGSGPNGEICFIDAAADAGKVILVDSTDADTATIERYPLPSGPILDPDPNTATMAMPLGFPRFFVDIETTVLTAGKAYKWKRNVTFRNGIPAKSTGTSVMFIAGGSPGSPNLPELSDLSLTLLAVMTAAGKQAASHLEAVIGLTQAKSQAGTGTLTTTNGSTAVLANSAGAFTSIRVGYQITTNAQTKAVVAITDATHLTVDSAFTGGATTTWTFIPPVLLLKRCFLERQLNGGTFKKFKNEPLLDNIDIQSAGVKTFSILIPTPKKTLIGLRATLVAVSAVPGTEGNSILFNATSLMAGDDPAFEDAGKPGAGGGAHIRWRDKSLRISFTPPEGSAQNMNTHISNKVILFFTAPLAPNVAFIWDPVTRTTFATAFTLAAPINPLNNSVHAAFLISLGKGGSFTFNNHIPHDLATAGMEIDAGDPSIFNNIAGPSGTGGTLFAQYYTYNQGDTTERTGIGTISGGSAITGVGTRFLTEVQIGYRITNGSVTKVVSSITDDTHLTLSSAFFPALAPGNSFTYSADQSGSFGGAASLSIQQQVGGVFFVPNENT